MSRIVVTGAAGYLGPHVVIALLDRGHDVVAAVRPGKGRRPGSSCRSRRGRPPRRRLRPAALWGPTPHAVVHLAWQDGFRHNSSAHMSQLSAHFDLLTGLAERGRRAHRRTGHHARGRVLGRGDRRGHPDRPPVPVRDREGSAAALAPAGDPGDDLARMGACVLHLRRRPPERVDLPQAAGCRRGGAGRSSRSRRARTSTTSSASRNSAVRSPRSPTPRT